MQISLQNMVVDTSVSKRGIQKMAQEKLQGAKFNVICSSGELDYVVVSDTYCLEKMGNKTHSTTCYAFRHSEPTFFASSDTEAKKLSPFL